MTTLNAPATKTSIPTQLSIVDHEETHVPIQYPNLLCDAPLAPKLVGMPLVENFNCHCAVALIGIPGSGKSSLVDGFLNTEEYFRGVWHHIYLFMPEISRKSISKSVFSELDPNQVKSELNLNTFRTVLEYVDTNCTKDPPENSLIVFDDVQASFKGECEKLLCDMMANRRHHRLSIFFLVQNYNALPKKVRKLCTDLFCFDICSSELDLVYDEHAKFYKQSWKLVLEHYVNRVKEEKEKRLRGEKYNKVFLYLNVPNKEIWINWQKVILPEETAGSQVNLITEGDERGGEEGRKKKRKREKESEEEEEDDKDEELGQKELIKLEKKRKRQDKKNAELLKLYRHAHPELFVPL